MKRFISIHENFLTDDIYQPLKHFAETTELYDLAVNNTIWNQRIVHAGNCPTEIKTLGKKYVELVRNTIQTQFEITKPLYTDILCFNRWRVGDIQHPHADDGNGFDWRKFGCVLYLNEDYEGGNIYFPNQQTSLKPKTNTLAFFPGDDEFLHGVTQITSGIRYTLSTFWTYDFNRSIIL
jgi:predicted 2-oxoglutarate/Fe(II)-dependent dioxygenase YbiX